MLQEVAVVNVYEIAAVVAFEARTRGILEQGQVGQRVCRRTSTGGLGGRSA